MGLDAEVVATGVAVVATWTGVGDVATGVFKKGSEGDSGYSKHVSDTVLTLPPGKEEFVFKLSLAMVLLIGLLERTL